VWRSLDQLIRPLQERRRECSLPIHWIQPAAISLAVALALPSSVLLPLASPWSAVTDFFTPAPQRRVGLGQEADHAAL
jgi:hypothetical protein